MNNEPSEIETLHPLEVRALAAIDDEQPFDLRRCAAVLTEHPEQAHQVMSWLHNRGYAEIASQAVTVEYELTERGERSARDGLLEERILSLLERKRRPNHTADCRRTQRRAGRDWKRSRQAGAQRRGAV